MTPARDDAPSLALALDAFLQEHRRCGELDGGLDDERVWMACDCGADIVQSIAETTMPEVEYHGRTIEPQSYQSDGGQWCPKAFVTIREGGSVRTWPIVAHVDTTFASEAEANAHAVEMAKKWIDERG